jgi:hypothetical protein
MTMAETRCPTGWTKLPSFTFTVDTKKRKRVIDPTKPRYQYGGMASGEGRLHMLLDTHTGKPVSWHYTRAEVEAIAADINAGRTKASGN